MTATDATQIPTAPTWSRHAAWSPQDPAAAPAFASVPQAEPPFVQAPSVVRVLASVAAMGLVAAAAALGAADIDVLVRAIPALAAPTLGAVVLTAPALVAVHQFFGLDAAPERLITALAHAVVAGGRIALGLVPVVLFFAATSTLWPLALAAAVTVPGIAMACVAVVGLRDAETTDLVMPPRFAVLLVGWAMLSLAIALRIAVSMAELVAAGVHS